MGGKYLQTADLIKKKQVSGNYKELSKHSIKKQNK